MPWVFGGCTEGRTTPSAQTAISASAIQHSAAAAAAPAIVNTAPAATHAANRRGAHAGAGRRPAKMGNQRVLKPSTNGTRKVQVMIVTRRTSHPGPTNGAEPHPAR